jgi:hypothetical protein
MTSEIVQKKQLHSKKREGEKFEAKNKSKQKYLWKTNSMQ